LIAGDLQNGMVSLKQLRILICVAETGSLSRASDMLRLSQPALSRHIRLLESELKVQLFVRHGRGMTLTPAGEGLARRIGDPFRTLSRILHEAAAPQKDIAGLVTMGILPSTTSVLLPHLVGEANRHFPGVTLRIIEGYPGHMLEWVQKGDMDLALVYGPSADLHLRTEDVGYEEMVLVGDPGCGLRLDTPVPCAILESMPLILPSREHGVLSVVKRALRKSPVKLTIAHEADSAMMIKGMIKARFGLSIMPRSVVRAEVAEGSLSAAPLSEPRVLRELVLALPTNRQDSPATQAVINVFAQLVCDLAEAGAWELLPAPAMHQHSGALASFEM